MPQLTPTDFAPFAALLGGALIGLASVLLMAVKGRIAGISGIAARLLPPYADRDFLGRLAFLLGVVAAPLVYQAVAGHRPTQTIASGSILLAVSGLLVGFGTVWGSGCTSGHGVAGLSRLSKRSAVAVACFMVTATLTVFFVRHML